MGWLTGKVGISPSWRTRRAALERWCDEHRDAIAEGRAVVWVDNGPAQHRLNLELVTRHGLLLPPPARTTAHLAHDLLSRRGRVLERPGRSETIGFVAAALASAEPAIERYARFATRPRTCATLAAMLDRLRGEEPDGARWVERWADQVPHRRADLTALAALERAVNGLLASRGKTPAAAINLAAAEVVEPGCLGQVEALLLYDLAAPGRSDRELVAAVCRRAGIGDRAAILPGEPEPERPLFASARALRAELVDAGLTVEPLDEPDGSPAWRLFGGGQPVPWPGLTVIEAPTPARAVDEALRMVRRSLQATTPRPSPQAGMEMDVVDTAVVVADLPRRADEARALADRYGVPARVLAPLTSSTPGTQAVVELLAVMAGDYPRAETARFLRRWTTLDGGQVSALDRCSLAAGIVDGAWSVWLGELEQLDKVRREAKSRVERVEAEDIATAVALARQLRQWFGDRRSDTPAGWREHLSALVRRLGLVVDSEADDEGEDEEPAPLSALAALDAWPAGQTLTCDEYARLAAELLAAGRGMGRDQPDALTVTVHPRLGCGRVRRVILVNPIAGCLPAKRGETVPLDRLDLERMGVDATGDGVARWSDEALTFLDTVSAAPELVVVLPRSDEAGAEALKSPLLEELLAVAVPGETRRVRMHERVPPPDDALTEAEWRSSLVTAALAGRPGAGQPRVAEVALREYDRLAGVGERYNGCLPAELVRERYGPERYWSPSRLESYAAWPFAFFLADGLGVEEVEEPDGQWSPLLEGSLAHEILRQAVAIPGTSSRSAERIAESVLSDTWRQPGLADGLWRRLRRRLAAWCGALVKADPELSRSWPAERTPAFLECRFGLDGQPPLLLATEAGPLPLCGIIDRIDTTPDGWVVIDYKRTLPGLKTKFSRQPNFQLPVYALAVGDLTDEPKLAGWAYVSYRRAGVCEGAGMAPGEIAEHIAAAVRELTVTVRRLRAGQFPPRPEPAEPSPGQRPDWALRAAARVLDHSGQTEDGDE